MHAVGHSLARSFVCGKHSHKLVLNAVDGKTNNNAGFNLANFRPKLLSDFFEEVIADYEKSFIGAFAESLCNKFLPAKNVKLLCSISKFVGSMGYALATNEELKLEQTPEEQAHLGVGTIPEFVPIS